MSALDRTFHETILRLLKGIVRAYDEWIKARVAQGQTTT